jgi:crotonobetainyl-CoA:carnitine CoA-transferase CaiB-like acyl-CoA transferase
VSAAPAVFAPLRGVRVVEVALLAPDSLAMHLADLGAEVVKVEDPGAGDYVRDVGAVKVEGVSALHRRWNRGKRSIALDLRGEQGRQVFEDLVRVSDVVVEGLRPGALARRGLGFADLQAVNPAIVLTSLSGYGQDGPYRELASHGVAYDAYAGFAPPVPGPHGWPTIRHHTDVGIHAAALFGALATVSAVLSARQGGTGAHIDIAQADVAAWWNGPLLELEEWRGRTPGETGPSGPDLLQSVRYQYYPTSDDAFVLFMATEEKFWRRFCEGTGRRDLYERFPPRAHSDHETGNEELRAELVALFSTRSQKDWVEFFLAHDIPGAPVYVGGGVTADPHFRSRARWLPAGAHGMAILGTPIRAVGATLPDPDVAPRVGEHTRQILEDVLGYGSEHVDRLFADGVLASSRWGTSRGGS